MGLPLGWVTTSRTGLTANQQIFALGNGVMPAQANSALRTLIQATRPELRSKL